MKIRKATPADARHISHAIRLGVGEEIVLDFAGDPYTIQDVDDLFAALAVRTDSQYSYLNTLVAEIEASDGLDGVEPGTVAGVCIAYDGARLEPLRRAFFAEAFRRLGRDMRNMDDETDAEEFYIDTLAVFEPFRHRGIATALLNATVERARTEANKPAGLLVDKDNNRARSLYESLGFRYVGDRPFAFVMMDHLRK